MTYKIFANTAVCLYILALGSTGMIFIMFGLLLMVIGFKIYKRNSNNIFKSIIWCFSIFMLGLLLFIFGLGGIML